MYFWTLALLSVATLSAADDQLALTLKAQSDFDRVELAAVPQLRDTAACVQTQAALLSVAAREEAPLVHYRKGYCALVGATLTHNPADFRAAASEFDKAVETWPDRAQAGGKNKAPEPISSGLKALAWIARLEAGADKEAMEGAWNGLGVAADAHACPMSAIPVALCEEALKTGRRWLGWIALQRGDLYDARKYFSGGEAESWERWVAGKQAFEVRNYAGSAAEYRRAIDAWTRERQEPAPPLTSRLNPPPNLALALTELGGAQFLAGDAAAAIATLDAAVKADPGDARAFYLRGRAKELSGQPGAALADYNLASRAAFADARDLASGEAHLYRGIMLYRRKDYARAEDEFSSALNFDIPPSMRPDAEAWRHLAAVAGGSCSASRQQLERSLGTVSPFFPKEEARVAASACAGAAPSAAGAANPVK